MNIKTVHTIVDTTPKELFDFMADVENHPKWATEFIQQLRKENGKYIAVTPFGEQFYTLKAHPDSRVIDFYGGVKEDEMTAFPTRIISLTNNKSLFLFTMISDDSIPEHVFKEQVQSLERELLTLKELFSS